MTDQNTATPEAYYGWRLLSLTEALERLREGRPVQVRVEGAWFEVAHRVSPGPVLVALVSIPGATNYVLSPLNFSTYLWREPLRAELRTLIDINKRTIYNELSALRQVEASQRDEGWHQRHGAYCDRQQFLEQVEKVIAEDDLVALRKITPKGLASMAGLNPTNDLVLTTCEKVLAYLRAHCNVK